VIGKLKYLVELARGTYLSTMIELGHRTYHPTVLTSFPCGLMVGAERGSILKGGGPIPQNGNKGEKLHV
jgi:hypothetical protein